MRPITILALAIIIAAIGISVVAIQIWQSKHSKVIIRGAGATFPLLQIEKWINIFSQKYPDITISYQGIGSGAGQSQFFTNTIDFCGSDPPLTKEKWEKYRKKIMQIPYLLGAVVVVYNVPEIGNTTLKLSGNILALIYKGDIIYWDDQRIKEINPGLKLPHKQIIVAYRADASGTQYIFTLYLHKAAPNIWNKEWISKTMKSPIIGSDRTIGGKGNAGVVQIIKNTPYSIGFIEWSYAIKENLPIAAVENPAGEYVVPSIKSLMKAAKAAAENLPKDPRGDFSKDVEIIVYAKANGAYPLTSWTHLIMWTKYSDPSKAHALAKFLEWIYKEGYNNLVPGYAPPPEDVQELLVKAIKILESS